MFKHIIVPLDGSDRARQAVPVAAKMVLSELKHPLVERLHFWYAHPTKTGENEEYRLMDCPIALPRSPRARAKKTKLGYATFFCLHCQCTFNERTGPPFNYLEFPTDIVLLVVFWRLRYKLSLRDLAEMFLERGFTFTHEAVRDWEARFAPLLALILTAPCGAE